MQYLINFLETGNIESSEIYAQLKCGPEEAKLLQLLARKFVEGQEDYPVTDLLQELYGSEDYAFLKRLPDVRILLELGWVSQQSFTPLKLSDATDLELLNTAVALTPSFSSCCRRGRWR